MPELRSYFTDFLAKIRLTPEQVGELKSGHEDLRQRLNQDGDLAGTVVGTFLQGSYRRATIVQPPELEKADVDVIVVTRLDRCRHDPHEAMAKFRSFLDEHYRGCWAYQGRSIGIDLAGVKLDLVITSAPSEVDQKAVVVESLRSAATLEEAPDWRLHPLWLPPEKSRLLEYQSRMLKAAQEEEWRTEPLWIPDRDAAQWQRTHPLAQLLWTREKNKRTDGHFINLVKALKWWRRVRHPKASELKSYPLERIFGECCPDDVGSVAMAVTTTLEGIRERFRGDARAGRRPILCDYGIDQDVLGRFSDEGFVRFYQEAEAAAAVARAALEEKEIPKGVELWRQLFGERFPEAPDQGGSFAGGSGSGASGAGFSERRAPTEPRRERFA